MPYAIAIVVVALIAWDAFRRHLAASNLTEKLAKQLRAELSEATEATKLACSSLRADLGLLQKEHHMDVSSIQKELRETKQVARSTAVQQQTLTGARRRSV